MSSPMHDNVPMTKALLILLPCIHTSVLSYEGWLIWKTRCDNYFKNVLSHYVSYAHPLKNKLITALFLNIANSHDIQYI